MKRILASASLVVANSEFTRRTAVGLGFVLQKLIVVNPPIGRPSEPGPNAMREMEDNFDLTGRRIVLTVGRLFPRKGHAQVISAFGLLAARYPDLVYVMTGEGDYRKELERAAIRLGVQDRVRFVGFVAAEQLEVLYRRAEMVVSPTSDDDGDVEGFGIAFLEAAARGTPCIAGRSGGVEDAVVHDQTGLLIDGSDPGQLVAAMTRLLDDSGLRKRLGIAARSRAAGFTGVVQCRRLLDAMCEVREVRSASR